MINKWLAYERGIKDGGASIQTSQSNGSHRHKMFNKVATYESPSGGYVGLYEATYDSSGNTTAMVEIYDEGLENDLYTNDAAGIHVHDVNIPDHTHPIEYGIFLFDELPSSVKIIVDGNTVSEAAPLSGNNIDIIPYLEKDGDGKITRGKFHTIEIIPNPTLNNPEGLARINASVVKQIFIQSRGGGSY